MNYQESLEYLYERLPMFQRVGAAAIKKDLTNTIKLLDALGNPHKRFQSIHIAGTNGKGTSAHALAAILQSAGYRTGLYTSPHLKSFTERIRINGLEVEQDFVADFVTQHRALIESVNPSFFEVTVAMCFAYFASKEVDIAVIETGLGGRLDSTNVIDPIISLITMIGYDHADLLGADLPAIAGEKAGIIKTGRPVVIGADQPGLLNVFVRKSQNVRAPLFLAKSLAITPLEQSTFGQSFEVNGLKSQSPVRFDTDITAGYFLKNLPGILMVVEHLRDMGFNIDIHAIEIGLGNIKGITGLKGRWQLLGEAPLMVADISHNEPGLSELFSQVANVAYQQLHLIVGMVKDKDIPKALQAFPRKATYYFTQSTVPRSLSAQSLSEQAAKEGFYGDVYENVNMAIAAAKKNAGATDFILICGSTFVIAEIEDL